jgi:hypothetical protein
MPISDAGRAAWRIFLIQVAILLGLITAYKLYLPRHARELAARAAAAREKSIDALYQSSVEDSASEISVPLDGVIVKRHPQRLRTTLTTQEAESTLGIPDRNISDFRGGQHLTWVGTTHTLQAAFDAGRLYYLSLEDRATGHGARVYGSFDLWGPY